MIGNFEDCSSKNLTFEDFNLQEFTTVWHILCVVQICIIVEFIFMFDFIQMILSILNNTK